MLTRHPAIYTMVQYHALCVQWNFSFLQQYIHLQLYLIGLSPSLLMYSSSYKQRQRPQKSTAHILFFLRFLLSSSQNAFIAAAVTFEFNLFADDQICDSSSKSLTLSFPQSSNCRFFYFFLYFSIFSVKVFFKQKATKRSIIGIRLRKAATMSIQEQTGSSCQASANTVILTAVYEPTQIRSMPLILPTIQSEVLSFFSTYVVFTLQVRLPLVF